MPLWWRRPRVLQRTGRGSEIVQIAEVAHSWIQVTYGGKSRLVPLEPAVLSSLPGASSPSGLIRARSGVVPYTARPRLLTGLERWVGRPEPFLARIIGGRGGTGKTRLAVELCVRVHRRAGWLCGLLTPSADQAALDELVQVPTPRLVVVDYAESRRQQLDFLLPLLAWNATPKTPVRVVLLVRASPRRSQDWTEALRDHSDRLDSVVGAMDVDLLEEAPLSLRERRDLFSAAASAVAAHLNPPLPPVPAPPTELHEDAFTYPLLVVVAAYLALQTEERLPTTRAELLHELLVHEDRYWKGNLGELVAEPVLRRRVVALATLTGADSESEGVELLRLVPDLSEEGSERRSGLARWAHGLYPGPSWWNPLEPDLLGEYLVVTSYKDHPQVLADVLGGSRMEAVVRQGRSMEAVVRPLDLLARAAADEPTLAATFRPVLMSRLDELCSTAIAQASTETDLDLLLGARTVGAVLDRAVKAIGVNPTVLPALLDRFPKRSDLVLNPLMCTLTEQVVAHLRSVRSNNDVQLQARWLHSLSGRLADVGRRGEALTAIEEAVTLRRGLATANRAVHEPDLARSLVSLSDRLADSGQRDEALKVIAEATGVYWRLAAANPSAYEPDLARSLNNLSVHFTHAGHRDDALKRIEEAVRVYRRLAAANPSAYEPDLARSFNNLSILLASAGQRRPALEAIKEAVALDRRLAATNPSAYEPDLARSLNNLALRLGDVSELDQALVAIAEAVRIRRRLAAANPSSHEPDLARSLHTQSMLLADSGRSWSGQASVAEAVRIRRRLAAAHSQAYEPDLARSLDNLSLRLSDAGRRHQALAVIENDIQMGRGQPNPDTPAHLLVQEWELARSLDYLPFVLADADRHNEALEAAEEAVVVYRRLVAANPRAYERDLARSLDNLSLQRAAAGRRPQALEAAEEAVVVYRRLTVADPAAYERDLARSLDNLSLRLADAGRYDKAVAVAEEAVVVYRRLTVADPAAYERDLARSLDNLSDRRAQAERARDEAHARSRQWPQRGRA